MKKIFLILVLVICTSSYLSAQWLTAGAVTSTTNAVGIGTTTPTLGKLQITGTADLLSLNSDGGVAQFNAYSNSDFRIIQRSNAILTFWTNTAERLRVDQIGNVGIGTTSPMGKLHVSAGNIVVDTVNWYCSRNSSGLVAPIMGINKNTVYVGDLFGNLNNSLVFRANGSNQMVLSSAGNVSIGTNDPMGYKLAVNGTAIATSMTVKLNANWPDYVFKSSYQLSPLKDIEGYINRNHHLPEIPSAEEISEKGQNLGEMNQLLLKKVEELTLYLIEFKKDNEELKERLKKIEERLNN